MPVNAKALYTENDFLVASTYRFWRRSAITVFLDVCRVMVIFSLKMKKIISCQEIIDTGFGIL